MAEISKISLGGVEYDIRDQKLKEDVEKKADKTYVDEEAERVVGYAEEVADNAEKAAKKYADDNKVAKVDGKQLSTEDFTTALKQKLDGLSNYDDADVRSAITELQNNLDAIVNGDATSAIDSIQEILAFLSTITDTQTLAGIVADLKQYVDDKVASGGSGGITEEKEVYIGAEEPTDENVKLWIDTDEEYEGGEGGGSIAVDDALSLESTNPVQNKVVTQYIGKRYVDVDILSGTGWDKVVALYESVSQLEFAPIIQCKLFNSIADVLNVSTKSGEKYVLLYSEGRTFYISRTHDILSLPLTINLDGITEREYAVFSTAFFVLFITYDSGNLWAKKGGKLYPVTHLSQGPDENGDAQLEIEICSGEFFHNYRLMELDGNGIVHSKLISSKYAGWEIPYEALEHSENDPYMFSGDELEHLVNMFTEASTPIVLGSDFGYLYPSATAFEYYAEDDVWVAYVEFPQTELFGSSAVVLIEYWVESKEIYAFQID